MPLFLLLGLVLAAPLENASFESLDGWEIGVGAHHGGNQRPSLVKIDDGKLHMAGDARTDPWRMVLQRVPVKPNHRVLFRVAARCENLRREGNQYQNANALLIFEDAAGKRLGLHTSAVLGGTRDWIDLHVHALAPKGAASVRVGVFSSMTGSAWFDNARLAITHTTPLDKASRAAAVDALRVHLDRTYPFFGLDGKPKSAPDLKCDIDSSNFIGAVQSMLAQLHDVHVWIRSPLGLMPTVPPKEHPRHWNQARLPKSPGRIGDVGYLAIPSFEAKRFGGIEDALDDLLKDTRALIIDVRFNGGGDENLARRIAGRFTDKVVTYAGCAVRDPTKPDHAFGPVQQRQFRPLKGRKAYTKPVVVLQGPYCVSSAEGFLMMMTALDHVTTVGLPSRGASANPQPFPLLPGFTVWSSTWRSLTPRGICIEGRGVTPMRPVDAGPDEYKDRDPMLEAALKLLSKG